MLWNLSMAPEWRARAETLRTVRAQAPSAFHLRSDSDTVGNLGLNVRAE